MLIHADRALVGEAERLNCGRREREEEGPIFPDIKQIQIRSLYFLIFRVCLRGSRTAKATQIKSDLLRGVTGESLSRRREKHASSAEATSPTSAPYTHI